MTVKRNSNLILHMIKSCENYELTEKESLETINKILDKDVSRRTYYNYKKKLYNYSNSILFDWCYISPPQVIPRT